MLKLIDTKTIASHYACAVINGDFSGLDDNELELVTDLVNEIGANTVEIVEGSDNFAECEVCNLYADTIDINIYEWEGQ